MSTNQSFSGTEIAIIGMAGRFPQAGSVQEFWENLLAGKEALQVFSDETLLQEGISPHLLNHPDFVKAGMPLDDISCFDPSFFGYTPKEAALMDPQHRFLLEVAWESLENSGYVPEKTKAIIAIYAGCGTSHYDKLLLQNRAVVRQFGGFEMGLAVNPTHLTTRIAYKFNLKGPAITLATACSTSLSAVHLGCQSLLNLESDLALAGGVSLKIPQKGGYLYHKEGILSPDGHCRAFDAQAKGTAGGNGAAMVVLRRLEDALDAGDHIYAVIKGSALNNDGCEKAGYVAPSVSGQAGVITEALAVAEIHPATIGYVEAHGTGTPVGDPIEVTALARAFDLPPSPKCCALGSLKTHIGHLDAAAGVAGLIKTALMLKHAWIPPNLHYQSPNPLLELGKTPFYIPTKAIPWPQQDHPRRAGVSSFGMGGTNAHAVLEQAPIHPAPPSSSMPQLLLFSAKTPTALTKTTAQVDHFLQQSAQPLAHVAFTLAQGRADFPFRGYAVSQPTHLNLAPQVKATANQALASELIFLLSGQGSEYVGMGGFVYAHFSHFRNTIHALAKDCEGLLDSSLVAFFRPGSPPTDFPNLATKNAVLFALSYGLGSLFIYWGLKPAYMVGLSLGEYVAASLAGTLTSTQALGLVIKRAKLVETLPAAKVLSVATSPQALALPAEVELTIHSAPDQCVIAGPSDAVEAYQNTLEAKGIDCLTVTMNRGFHSSMTLPLEQDMIALCQSLPSNQKPSIPYFSNVTGSLCTSAELDNKRYWFKHLSSPVAFWQSIAAIPTVSKTTFLEIGPGQTLSKLVERQRSTEDHYLSTLPKAEASHQGYAHFLDCIGKLWASGASLRWERFFEDQQVKRLPLPTYPFEHQSYWVYADKEPARQISPQSWYYLPQWEPNHPLALKKEPAEAPWLVVDAGWSQASEQHKRWLDQFITYTQQKNLEVHYSQAACPTENLLQQLGPFDRIIVLFGLNEKSPLKAWVEKGYLQLANTCKHHEQVFPGKAYGLTCITLNGFDVSGIEKLHPETHLLSSALKVVAGELPHLQPRHIDITQQALSSPETSIVQVVRETLDPGDDYAVALRGHRRWTPFFLPFVVQEQAALRDIRKGGTYLITGGLGRIGQCIALVLANYHQAHLVLVSRKPAEQVLQSPQWQQHQKAIESAGGAVRYYTVDCSQREAMTLLKAQVQQQWGHIHGIFHTAAETSGPALKTPFMEQTAALLEDQLKAKYHATQVLHEVFAEASLDFCMLFSSNAAVLGRSGYAAYAAANSLMDGLAHEYAKTGFPIISVNWDGWELSKDRPLQSPLLMDATTGAKAISDLLKFIPGGQVIVSKEAFAPRAAQWLFRRKPHQTMQAPDIPSHRGLNGTSLLEPESPMQQELHDIWCAILGRDQISINASFFDLGGHSLMGTQVMSRIRDRYGLDLPVGQLYDFPSVIEFAAWLETQQLERAPHNQPDIEKAAPRVEEVSLQDLEAELEGLSEEDLRGLLP